MKGDRLDQLLVTRGLSESKERAAALIMAGKVLVDGRVAQKSGEIVGADAQIELKEELQFVGRGALKLEEAFTKFDISVLNKACADVGSSTGGFTEVMLNRGARKVFAIDVGYGELDFKLRKDPRVEVMERTNARYVENLSEPIDFVTIDVSFISVRILLPVIKGWLAEEADLIVLIKPQFEAPRDKMSDGGIIKDPLVTREVLTEILNFALNEAFITRGLCPSPIKGRKGNQEYLMWLSKGKGASLDVTSLLNQCL